MYVMFYIYSSTFRVDSLGAVSPSSYFFVIILEGRNADHILLAGITAVVQ